MPCSNRALLVPPGGTTIAASAIAGLMACGKPPGVRLTTPNRLS